MNWYNFTADDILKGIDLHVRTAGKVGALKILMHERVKHEQMKKTVESLDSSVPNYDFLQREIIASSQQVDLYAWAIERIYKIKNVLEIPFENNYMQIRSKVPHKASWKKKIKKGKGKKK